MNATPETVPPPRADWRRGVLLVAAALYACGGFAALLWFSPRVPYADEWRQFTRLLTQPFARGVLSVDNGHAEVLPNVVRWADLRLAGGHERLIVLAAALCLALSAALLLRALRRDAALDALQRAAATFALAFGLFWLGNVHALAVLEDAAHVAPLLVLIAFTSTRATGAAPLGTGMLAALGACAVLAVLTFGSGWALFPALALAFWLRRERALAYAALGVSALAALAVYLALPGALPAPEAAASPLAALVRTLQLLGAPFVYLLWPLLDPSAAAAVPAPLHGVAATSAQAWTALFGDIRTSTLPQALVGAGFCIAFALALRGARRPGATPTQRLGVTLAAFALGCAVLIAVARAAYFDAHPDQVYALRYVPWSVLGWSGLLLAAVARVPRARHAATLAVALAFVAIPAEIGLGVLARHTRDIAEDVAVATAVGMLPAEQALGENPLDDLRGARRPMRLAQTSVFGWPETLALLKEVPAEAVEIAAPHVVQRAAINQFGGSGTAIDPVELDAPACAARLLLARGAQTVGMLRKLPDGRWHGVIADDPGDDVRVLADCR